MRLSGRKKAVKQHSASDGSTDDVRLVFVPDEPADFGQLDAFGHKAYAETLLRIVTSAPDAPFCVGVIGGWGTGKSGIKDELSRLLASKQPAIRVVDFDAWEYSRDCIQRSFLELAVQQLDVRKEVEREHPNFFWGSEVAKKTSSATIGDMLRFLWRHKVVLLLDLLLFLWLFFSFGFPKVNEVTGRFSISLLLTAYIPVFWILFKLVLDPAAIRREDTTKTAHARYGSTHQYRQVFDCIMTAAGAKGANRVVVTVDNLDRCPPKEVEDVLSAIKTFYSDKRVIYVVFCDDTVLQNRLTDSGVASPGEYMRKFFSTSLRIADPVGTDVVKYCTDLLEKVHLGADPRVSDTIVASFAKNPRRAIQLVNRLVAYADLAKRYEASGRLDPHTVTGNLPLLAKLLVIEEDHREFWEYLHRDPDALVGLTRLAQMDSTSGASERLEYPHDSLDQLGFGNNEPLLDFLRATSWVDPAGLSECLRLQRIERRGRVPNIDELRTQLITGSPIGFAARLSQAKGEYESEFVDACLDEITNWAKAKRWGLVHNGISLVLSHYDEFSEQVQDCAASRLCKTLSYSQATPIIFRLSPSVLMKVARKLEDGDRHLLIDKVLLGLDVAENRDAVIQAVAEQADMLTEREKERLSEHLASRLHEDEPSAVELIDGIRQKGDTPAGVLVEPLYAHLVGLKRPPGDAILN